VAEARQKPQSVEVPLPKLEALPELEELDALLLDLDDTILDDRGSILGSWTSAVGFAAAEHPALEAEPLGEAIAATTRWFWSDSERERRGRLDLEAAHLEIIGGAFAKFAVVDPRLVERTADHYHAARVTSYRMASGAAKALARLRVRFPKLALVTNGAARPQRAKIERFSLTGVFDHIQVEGEFGPGKPEPEVYHHVAIQLGAAPERCLMVGDNHRCDVIGALDAGMHAAWIDVAGRGEPPAPPPRPHATLRSLAELAELLGC
jgi:putative hydrolase of the HAD superfamily